MSAKFPRGGMEQDFTQLALYILYNDYTCCQDDDDDDDADSVTEATQ